MEILLSYLQGRNWNGASRDAGVRIHAISKSALCGAKPGRLSGGWTVLWEDDVEVSCPRCVKKLEKIKTETPLYKCSGCSTLISEGDWCDNCHRKGVLSVAAVMMSIHRLLHPVEPVSLSQEPPDSPFLRMIWEAAQESE